MSRTHTTPMARIGYAVNMRMFELVRSEDVSGVSGTGVVAKGVEFEDGTVVLKWATSLTVFPSVEALLAIHGHEGRTVISWCRGSA